MADTDIDRLVVRITADASLLQQEFAKARQSTQSFSQGSGSDLGSLATKTREAGDEIVKLKSEILALAGANEFKDLIEGAFNYADSLKNLSQQTGLSTDMLQTLHAAGEQVNLSTDSMDQALKAFIERLGVFATTGGGQAAKAFQQLGISTSNPIAAFDQVISKLAGISDTAARAGLAGQMFGREFGPAMAEIATQGVEGLVELETRLQSTGAFLSSELIDKAAQTKSQFGEMEFIFKQAFDEGIIDGFTSEFGSFADIIESGQFQTAIRNFGDIMGEIAAYVVKMGPYLPNIGGAWIGSNVGSKVGQIFGPEGAGIGYVGGGILGAMAPEALKQNQSVFEGSASSQYDPGAALKALMDNRDQLLAAQKKGKLDWEGQASLQDVQDHITLLQKAGIKPESPFAPTGNQLPIKSKSPTGTTQNTDDQVIENLQQQVQIQEEINEGKARQAAIDQALARLSTSATAAQKAQVSALAGQQFDEAQVAAQKKAVDDFNKSVDVQVNKLEEQTKSLGESDEQKYIDQQLLQTESELIRKGVTDLDAKTAALDHVREAATEAYDAQQQQARINEVTDMERQAYESLGNSIAQAAAKGQLSFKSLLSIGLDVAQQLEEAFLKLAVINPIENSIFGGSPGYSNLPTLGNFGKSALGNIFGMGGGGVEPVTITPQVTGASGDFFSSVFSDVGDMFSGFFADGGPVDSSKSYVVGEDGPEVFVPNVAGRIVPNSGYSNAASQGSSNSPSNGSSKPQFTMVVQTRDAPSFIKSEPQVAAMMSRMLARGQRNL